MNGARNWLAETDDQKDAEKRYNGSDQTDRPDRPADLDAMRLHPVFDEGALLGRKDSGGFAHDSFSAV